MKNPVASRYAVCSNPFLVHIANELLLSNNLPRALRILRAIMLGVRNCIPQEESRWLSSLLPGSLKPLYLEGWNSDIMTSPVYSMRDFVDEVYFLAGERKAFVNKTEAEKQIIAAVKEIEHFVVPSVWQHIVHCLPKPLRFHLDDYVMEGYSLIQ